MRSNKILGISIVPGTKSTILEKILIYIDHPTGFLHIVSLNPENLVIACEDDSFKKVIETAQVKIIDGIGIVLAGRWLGIKVGDRVTGVGLMTELLKRASDRRLRVLMIGGKVNIADKLVECYLTKYPEAKFKGLQGIVDIKNPTKDEQDRVFSIVTAYKPQLIFVAFGSPDQELWIERHKKEFVGSVVMGVGGAFDYLSGEIARPATFIQKIGLEWFFRLLHQPWRWRRQLRLIKFAWLVFSEKLRVKN